MVTLVNSPIQPSKPIRFRISNLKVYSDSLTINLQFRYRSMASLTQPLSGVPVLTVSRLHYKNPKSWKFQNLHYQSNFPCISRKRCTIVRANLSPWEPAPTTYAPENEVKLLNFETVNSSGDPVEASITSNEDLADTNNQPHMQLQYLRWPLWFLGPTVLLVTGMVPTLWLPVSSIFLGPNIASLLSLTGLDCIFNLGASLFLLMADTISRSKDNSQGCISKPPLSYQFWNMVANVTGYGIPLAIVFGSQKGFLQPQLPFISFTILLGPYFLLLSVQMLTEMLTWHWKSPVWLVTPVVYESYRLLQLMRALKLGAELGSPSWMVHTIRGLVCCWVLVLGVQLMRIAWYAGFTAYQQHSAGGV